MSSEIQIAKGHGTENDFVLVSDPDGHLDLTTDDVTELCDRRRGLGGDGLIRVVRSTALPEGVAQAGQAEWFMDYHNADGSPAQMCGNGVRVFARYLEHLGVITLADGAELAVATRSGTKIVRRDGDLLAADLGPWRVVGGEAAAANGGDAHVTLAEPAAAALPALTSLPALTVDVGNPHTVVVLPTLEELLLANLRSAPQIDPEPVDGSNVELIVPVYDSTAAQGHLQMRVHERGVGETRSCGTGAVAAVLAARVWAGPAAPAQWTVDVPGGRLRVSVPAADRFSGDHVELAGPAVIVATGVWLAEFPHPALKFV